MSIETISCIPKLPDPVSCSTEFARHLHDALVKVGAAYIPVPGLIEDGHLLSSLQSLFALDEVQKRSLAQQLTSPWQGVYIALGKEQLADGQEDYKEVLDINLENGTYAQWIKRRQQSNGDTRISTAVDDFLSGSEDLATIIQSLCHIFKILQEQANHVLAALENIYQQLPDSLVKQHGENSTLRLLHYPSASHLSLGTTRLGAHQDYSGITLLWQDSTGGLEIFTPQQEWIGIDIPSGCIGIIASELMQRWSGETLHGAPHRVRITNVQQAHMARYSIAFFCETNDDCMVYPRALIAGTNTSAENPIAIKTFLNNKYDQILMNLDL
ncbi:isopenicillin N synthase family oxygenase [Desertifilum sp. FACHB-1129]|uniref:isopenicillin N synthase family oxygenase n=1 Tax=unclassified Desertifilum TaxID=2621682 RepID=UPI00168A27BD|nr:MULTISPECIES: isopenicillin N synthase family oxygenase [unclassified Desertifilum]MBD2311242.1 isopenicillin N synthase family oxygenase [Desertifilum sp. FACHB-1129]MBD2324313.1 isopenicillin N synthase family oxygenase [Desertifilum sp. FACHB-866]MBD2334327.1 isopenicillin N synthase family oxygenase [Desertifilum sp. FACHB-868]MDA0213173.1 isopenicillin N synthase family oxygenase [Cyanobacteria bacterium FC1]